MKPYWSWRWWVRWLVPLPILLWYSRRVFGTNHVWYQDSKCQLELRGRFVDDAGFVE